MAKTTRTIFQFDSADTMDRDGISVVERQLVVDDFGDRVRLSIVSIYGLATSEIDVPDDERRALAAAVLGLAGTPDATDDRYWDGFDAALVAVEDGQRLYGTTQKALAALRVVSRVGREASPATGTLDGEASSS